MHTSALPEGTHESDPHGFMELLLYIFQDDPKHDTATITPTEPQCPSTTTNAPSVSTPSQSS
jgi:hypothetical protein